MRKIKQSTLLKISFLFVFITLACNFPTAIREGAYGDEGVDESLFLIEDIRFEPEVGLPGEFTLIIEDYDYFDDGDGGANSIDCESGLGILATFDGDDFRKDDQGNFIREMSYEDRFTRKFEAKSVNVWDVYCVNPGPHAEGSFEVAVQFFESDCQDRFSMADGLVLRPESTRANNKELSCLWVNGESTTAAIKISIVREPTPDGNSKTFDQSVNTAKQVSAYCKNHATPVPDVTCSCNENETSESEYYRRVRTGGCTYDSGSVTKNLEIEEIVVYKYVYIIYISSQEHNSDVLLYPDLHENALNQAKAFVDSLSP